VKKEKAIEILKADHKKLAGVLDLLSPGQPEEVKVLGEWTTKDIIAHLIEWNWEYLAEIERILADKATWHKVCESKEQEDEFNRKAAEKWRTKSFKEVLDEWEKSFQVAIKMVEKLTNEEWNHQSNKDTWSNGDPVTIYSLFDYEYEGTSHEGGHAKQIREFFKSKEFLKL